MSNARKDEISRALNDVRYKIPDHVTLIVVTKTFPVSDLKYLYELGERNFGENRDGEGSEKAESLADDIFWHFQGGIQSNKLRSIVNWSDYIHSLDKLDHATKISNFALSLTKKQNCFIQINLDSAPAGTNNEPHSNRSGINIDDLPTFAVALAELGGVKVVGVMGVGPHHHDPRPSFELLHSASQELQKVFPTATFISAGMSGDFEIAIECGATHVRIGSSILGSR
jgi:pyridoxal phosphate enzyme (YggS family)